MKKRNLFVMFILLLLCPRRQDGVAVPLLGIYHIYWHSKLNSERRKEQPALRYLFVMLLVPVTLGISFFVWQWKTVDWLGTKTGADRRVLTLILSILLVGFLINPLVLQSDINKYLSRRSASVDPSLTPEAPVLKD